jgi:Glycolipid 2-alpha-mannosyltransferase
MKISSLALWIALLALAVFQAFQIYNIELTNLESSVAVFVAKPNAVPSVIPVIIPSTADPPQHTIGFKQEDRHLPAKLYRATVWDAGQKPAETTVKARQKAVATELQTQEYHTPFTILNTTCQAWPRHSHLKPSGLVVTLILTPDDFNYLRTLRSQICQSIPSQLIHLVGPQQWDMLLVVAGSKFRSVLTNTYLQKCLNLTEVNEGSQQWINLDGSNLNTTRYLWQNSVSVYLAHDSLKYPKYIENEPSILKLKIEPEECDAPKSYIQGTKWYADEMLHLRILQNYHWFIKLDIDLFFGRTVEWDLLHDLQQRESIFAHTAQLPNRSGRSCADGIVKAVQDFMTNKSINYCASDSKLLKIDRDFYYSNFIIGRVDFWTQPLLLEFSRFLAEYQPGFYHMRWTDQIFWAQAMGLVIGLDNVVDYSELRCSVETNCWTAVSYVKLYGDNSYARCDNNAYFRHNKNPHLQWNPIPTHNGSLWKSDTKIYQTKYKDDCTAVLNRKRMRVKFGKEFDGNKTAPLS